MYFDAIISITYRANNRITSDWRNTFESVKCIFNERGRFSAFAMAMTLHLDFDSRTGHARSETQSKACWGFAEIHIPVVLLQEGRGN